MYKKIAAILVVGLISACSSTSTTEGKEDSVANKLSNGWGIFNQTPAQQQPVAENELDGIVPGSQEDLVLNIGDKVFFSYDSAVLDGEAQETLSKQASWLKRFNHLTVTVEGHCDERGTREYNLALGERRAVAVQNYLISSGVESDRVAVVSYGKERPELLGMGEDVWHRNRRAILVVN